MKIGIPLLSIGWHGGIRVLVEFANYMADTGHEVTVLVSRGRVLSTYRFCDNVSIRHVGIRTPAKYLDYAVYLAVLPFCFPRNCVAVANFFVTCVPVRLYSWARGLDYLYFVQDIEAKYSGIAGGILNALCRWTYRDTHIVAANRYLYDRLRREYGVAPRYVSIGPSDLFLSTPRSANKSYDIIYFLRREPWKGLDRFLRLLQLARGRFSFLCISQDAGLFDQVVAAGVACRKPNGDAELISCLDSARLLFFSSSAEGFALPPLEAMARGVPAVLFRCGGPDAYIEDRVNAVYVDSEESALEVIGELLADADRYAKMSAEARATASSYQLTAALQQLGEYLAGCAGSIEGRT
jgi:glycosyltransferase involved in cell wall biosynthesis